MTSLTGSVKENQESTFNIDIHFLTFTEKREVTSQSLDLTSELSQKRQKNLRVTFSLQLSDLNKYFTW